MTKTILATYDGEVLRLHEPLPLPADTQVRVTIETPVTFSVRKGEPGSFIRALREANLEGPPDWSIRVMRCRFGIDVGEPYSFLRAARALAREKLVEGPPDWSSRLEEYMYGRGQ